MNENSNVNYSQKRDSWRKVSLLQRKQIKT